VIKRNDGEEENANRCDVVMILMIIDY